MYRLFSHVIVALIASISLVASLQGQPSMNLDDKLPLNPAVRTGRLSNGLTYYIQRNVRPEKRAELRLVVRTGSVLEHPNQQGLAHFTEHMAFNGTKNFQKHELVSFLEGIGMTFGADLNANTSFDQTIYLLQVPTEEMKIMDRCMLILQDWAQNVSFENEEIDKERGVVVEEWRLRQGADTRMREKVFPVIFHNSKYAERFPIGLKPVLDTFHYETIKSFYRDWYRPDIMAVVAVGDFEVDAMEAMIKAHFKGLTNPPNAPARTEFDIPDHAEPLVGIATDREASSTELSAVWMHPVRTTVTVGDFRDDIIDELYDVMLNNRYSEVLRKPNAPFISASSSYSSFGRAKNIYSLDATVSNGAALPGFEALLTEAERVKRFGFTASELERAKADMLNSMERAYNERDKTESGRLARAYISLFTNQSPASGIEYEYALYKNLMPSITVAHVNAVGKRLMTEENRVITVTGPEKEGVAVPTRQELLALYGKVAKADLKPYVDAVSDAPLVSNLPAPGSVASERTLDAIGVTEWTLSNGIRVVLKPTTFKNDEVRMSAFSPGGTSLVSDADYISASNAISAVTQGGVGPFGSVELEKKLSGKSVGVSPTISELFEGFGGQASPKDLETMFQLVYLYATAPRKDAEGFAALKARFAGILQNRSADPQSVFSDTVQATISDHHLRRRPTTVETLDQIDLDRALAIYRDRFADLSDFTFLFVGNFDVATMRPLAEKYLATLPATHRTENWHDIGVHPPKGVVSNLARKGVEPKATVLLQFNGPFSYTPENRLQADAMMEVVEFRLRESLREESGGTYGVGARIRPSKIPQEQYALSINFGCAPNRVDELVAKTFAAIEKLKSEGPTEEEVGKVREAHIRKRETDLKENRFWMGSLQAAYITGEDPLQIPNENKLLGSITTTSIQAAAKKYFDMSNYIKILLVPENL